MSKQELQTLIRKREQLNGHLTRTRDYFLTFDRDSDDVLVLNLRLGKLESVWSEFNEIQSKIELKDQSEIQGRERDKFEESYFELVSSISRFIESKSIQGLSSSVRQCSRVKLPTISLPKFDGSYGDWLPFYDTFSSLIDSDDSLSDIQKFHYLSSSLGGVAAEVIQSIEISSVNYALAWKLLIERFQNRRAIIQTHLKALFDMDAITKESAILLRSLSDNFQKHLRSLKSLGLPTESWDAIIIYLITTKFDTVTKREWETHLCTIKDEFPKINDLSSFLSQRCQILEAISNNQACTSNRSFNNHSNKFKGASNAPQRSSYHTMTQLSCYFCKQSHTIYQCKEFLKLTIIQRREHVGKLKLCLNCLRPGHANSSCKYGVCKECGAKHNTLLHNSGNKDQFTSHSHNETKSVNSGHSFNTSNIVLATALINVLDSHGNIQVARALLDSGSQSCFMTETLCQRLQLKRTRVNIPLYGINQSSSLINYSANIHIQSRFNKNYQSVIQCYILRKITNDLPSSKLNLQSLDIPSGVQLADPTFHTPDKIEILLGAEIFWEILEGHSGGLNNRLSNLHLRETKLGWIISGKALGKSSSMRSEVSNLAMLSHDDSENLDHQLARFWQVEDCSTVPTLGDEQLFCEQHFIDNTSRDIAGRFVVKLPFYKELDLGYSLQVAIRRFHNLEKRLDNNIPLRDHYFNFINEYLSLGHMEYVSKLEDTPPQNNHFYLPHHAVIKETSSTTKLRVVFDGSVQSSTGVSLNESLAVGPTIQADLFTLLIRFRSHRYVLTADIEKMYRQIKVDSPDSDYQRILWRPKRDESINVYRLSTVTYGTSCAPFLAIRCLQQLAHEERLRYPIGSNIILNDFYVDDLLTGSESIHEGIEIRNQVMSILEKGGFHLRKWCSNDPLLLEGLLPDQVELNTSINFDSDLTIKTLGLWWNPLKDIFQYKVLTDTNPPAITKRYIISEISKIFDPLGLIGPVVVTLKIFLQQLWKHNLPWDGVLPDKLIQEWNSYHTCLPLISQLSIPRFIFSNSEGSVFQVHGFCDASEQAYGACIYIRNKFRDRVNTYLVCSKSRVAPIKKLTLPRLELCGAVLLSNLMKKFLASINMSANNDVYCWTDSKIVLAWLDAPASKWKTFVANRVAEIQSVSHDWCWKHVSSKDNPADILSRGLSPKRLIISSLWWSGPDWLQEPTIPVLDNNFISDDQIPERRITTTLTANVLDINIFNKYSSFKRLQRVTAYIFRFVHNAKNKLTPNYNQLSVEELENATRVLIRVAQLQCFNSEICALRRGSNVNNKSVLLDLRPFLDDDGLLRVGGRLAYSNLPYNQKHPIILPGKHILTELMIRHEHIKQLHAGTQLLLASFRLQYWPINGRQLTKSIIHKCITCFRSKVKYNQPIMGNLPHHRVTPARTFQNTGVDFFGPLQILQGSGRGKRKVKAYAAIFVCLVTKAVHIELVGDLSTQSFINSLKRFISRRGMVSNIYCDNGTNFVGAKRELNDLYNLFLDECHQNQIIHYLFGLSINWHFSPPRAPNFGGLWEAGVKSFKVHLRKITTGMYFTFEEMYTLLSQIESCLNSRPISPLTDDPNDLSPLTPGHFLVGDSPSAICEPDLTGLNENRLSRWQRVQLRSQHFWRRWSAEYIHTLQRRSKWRTSTNNLEPGTMVLVHEDNTPPTMWCLGRIVQVHPGQDGITRVATIMTKNGNYKRAVSKLCALPIEDNLKVHD